MRKKTFLILLMGTLFLFMIFVSPFVVTTVADDEDEDGIANDIEDLNHHELDVQYNNSDSQLNSEGTDTGDEFELEVSAGEDGLSLKIAYNSVSGSTEIELVFQVIFYALIEYVDVDANGMYNSSVDTFINQSLLNSFQPIEYTNITTGLDTTIHVINIITTDGVFSTRIYAVEEFEVINNTLITPAEFKIDIEIHNFNYASGSSDLALKMTLVSTVEYETEFETDDENAGYAENETEIETTISGYTGFFSWTTNALVDGIEKEVKASPVVNDEMYLNYPRGTHIIHDPKMGIEGILHYPLIGIGGMALIGLAAAVATIFFLRRKNTTLKF